MRVKLGWFIKSRCGGIYDQIATPLKGGAWRPASMALVTSALMEEPNVLVEEAEPEPEDAIQSRRTLTRAAATRRHATRRREQTGAGSAGNLEAPTDQADIALLPAPMSPRSTQITLAGSSSAGLTGSLAMNDAAAAQEEDTLAA